MEKITKTGKDFDETLNLLLEENNLQKDDIVYKKEDGKKGLFKGSVIELTAYKKEDIYTFAKEYLKTLINNLGLEVNFELTTGDRTCLKMFSDNNNILIGHNGNTLRALETILKQKILIETGIYFNLTLDVENYKDKRDMRIERLAKKVARDVVKTKAETHLENMNAYERRIVHNALTDFKGVITKSEGEEPNRHVVIIPSKE